MKKSEHTMSLYESQLSKNGRFEYPTKEKIKSVMIGHAVGDALGVPVEFCEREELDEAPVTEMLGYGTYPFPKGTWSDDTSMSLAALDSLAKGSVDYEEIMNNFVAWLYGNQYTPTGIAFDVGKTCSKAIRAFIEPYATAPECGLTDERSNGNGSLMRIHPFVLYANVNDLHILECFKLIESASSMTHAHERSRVGCLIYMFILFHLLYEPSKCSLYMGLKRAECHLQEYVEIKSYERLFKSNFASLKRDEIKSSGYVVDTLEAAVWCVLTTDSYKECVLKAVNLGDDSDTVAAVAGGLAGALYGYDAIPSEWRDTLIKREYIEEMCDKAAEAWGSR